MININISCFVKARRRLLVYMLYYLHRLQTCISCLFKTRIYLYFSCQSVLYVELNLFNRVQDDRAVAWIDDGGLTLEDFIKRMHVMIEGFELGFLEFN